MEAFSFLKYWRGNGGGASSDVLPPTRSSSSETTTIVAAASQTPPGNDADNNDGDEGPFFDLEFSVPNEDDPSGAEVGRSDEIDGGQDDNINESEEEEDSEEEREFNFTLSDSSNDRADTNLSLSPSDDLFFKGKLVPIETSSIVINGSEQNSKPQFKVSLLKSATKFRVFMLGFKKSNNGEEKSEPNESIFSAAKHPQETPQNQPEKHQQPNGRRFTVKFKVEEVPIVSLFTRDNSSRSDSANKPAVPKQNLDEVTSDEKKFPKDVMNKYLKLVKPLYIRVSRKYGEKQKFSGQLSLAPGAKTVGSPLSEVTRKPIPCKSAGGKSQTMPEATEAPGLATALDNNAKSQKSGNMPAGLRVVRKHLGKSRSASSAVAAAPAGPAPSRRDDSLLEQQDGIQSAILHCKRSFNASRDSDSPPLSISFSNSPNEKPADEEKDNQTDDDLPAFDPSFCHFTGRVKFQDSRKIKDAEAQSELG